MTVEEAIVAAVERAVDRRLAGVEQQLAALVAAQPPRMLTIAEAAEALGCHPNTVSRMVKAGQLVYKRVGRAVRIDSRSLNGAGGGR